MTTSAPQPLAGVTVVSVEQAVAVPFATRQLADLGARVIKIERPETGDFARRYDESVRGLSSVFLWLNRGKESLELDIHSAEGSAILRALLERADVFLHNISPAAARRAGLDSDTLSGQYRRLVSGSVSGYGGSGPMADAKAYDLLVQGESGLMSLNGTDAEFAKVGISIADIAAGMYTYSSVLAALYHRLRTGEVLPVDISLFDSVAEWLSYPMYYTQHGGSAPRRMGTSHATIAPYGGFDTQDGKKVLLAVQNAAEWQRFCDQVVRLPALADDPKFRTNPLRVAHREALDRIIGEAVAQTPLAEFRARLDQADIASARLNSISELYQHEQLTQRPRWTDVETEVGDVPMLRPPWTPKPDPPPYGAVPALGQHNASILEWLRRDGAAIDPEVDEGARSA